MKISYEDSSKVKKITRTTITLRYKKLSVLFIKSLFLLLFAASQILITNILPFAITLVSILSCHPEMKPIIISKQYIDRQFEDVIKLLKKQIYAINKEGDGINEIRIYYLNENSLKYTLHGFGSFNVHTVSPLSVYFGGGRFETYVCPNEDEFTKLKSVFKSGSFKAPTLRYNDFLIVSYMTKEDKAKRIFNNLKREKKLPPIFTKYFDVIGYLINSQKNLKVTPIPNGLKYQNNLEIVQQNEIISSPKTAEGIVIHIGWENAIGIIITDFNSNYLKFYTDLSFPDSILLNEPVNVGGAIGRFREIKETIFYTHTDYKRIRYFHMLFFRFGEMLMYIRFPITSNKIDKTTKDEWLDNASHILKAILPYLVKHKNIQID